jgi:hypothetical protein
VFFVGTESEYQSSPKLLEAAKLYCQGEKSSIGGFTPIARLAKEGEPGYLE